jgi:putative FmdB family regulatory protein
MPIYEYRCQSCGHTLDALQKISDPHLTDCPDCGKSALKRLMSAPSFRLKGGGWYETDFKSDKEKKRNLVDSKSDSGGDGKAPDNGAKESKASGDGAKSSGDSAKSSSDSAKPSTSAKSTGGSGSEAA